jgi:hypothetical protein
MFLHPCRNLPQPGPVCTCETALAKPARAAALAAGEMNNYFEIRRFLGQNPRSLLL